ncbi:MAG: phosphomannomutase/phosphoglucomutase, partial [Halomonas sp.]
MNPDSRQAVPASIFRAYDIRGIVDDTLTEASVEAIGRAIGSEAAARGESTVVVARDGRLSGPRLQAALIRGLNAAGRDVIDIGMVPTPVLYFATHVLDGTASGVMVTGSHNPPDYNGFKIVLGGETLSGDAITALHTRIATGDLTEGQGSVRQVDVRDAYLARILADVRLARPLKAVVDCGNGVAGELGPQLVEKLGAETLPLFAEIDGTFPNHHPDPGKPENLQDLIQAVQESGADIGLAFDGDGDRLGVITPAGKLIYPDHLLMAFAEDMLSRNPGARVIFDVKCTGNLTRVIEEAGGEPEMWRTGHSLIKARMKETGAALAGEMSGHIFFKERWYGFDDGLYGAARLLEILSRQ